jgi:hypothetical protein
MVASSGDFRGKVQSINKPPIGTEMSVLISICLCVSTRSISCTCGYLYSIPTKRGGFMPPYIHSRDILA